MSDLVPEWRIGSLSLTDWPYAIPFGADYGTPDASPEVLASFLSDGDLELTSRLGNRTLTLPVLIESSDMVALAAAEAALVVECDKPLNTLYVDPGDGLGEPFQFTVFRGQVTFRRDDDYERAGYRLFEVVWRAEPWPEATTEVSATLTTTTVGTAHQQIGTFTAAGAVRARGSLSIEHATKPLDEVLVYTSPVNYTPACRAFRISGTATPGPDSSSVSGNLDLLDQNPGSITYRRPVTGLPPGDYLVMARASSGASGTHLVTASAIAKVNGVQVSAEQTGGQFAFASAAGTNFYRLGWLRLPPTDLPGNSLGTVDITVKNTAVTSFQLDETYLFNMSIGRLSQFSCGLASTPTAGQYNNRLWIDSPSVDNDGLGRYLMGTQADRSDAYSALTPGPSLSPLKVAIPAVHEFGAGATTVFVVSTQTAVGFTAPVITYRYRPAGHSSVYSGS